MDTKTNKQTSGNLEGVKSAEELKTEISGDADTPKRGRGRPAGSKTKKPTPEPEPQKEELTENQKKYFSAEAWKPIVQAPFLFRFAVTGYEGFILDEKSSEMSAAALADVLHDILEIDPKYAALVVLISTLGTAYIGREMLWMEEQKKNPEKYKKNLKNQKTDQTNQKTDQTNQSTEQKKEPKPFPSHGLIKNVP